MPRAVYDYTLMDQMILEGKSYEEFCAADPGFGGTKQTWRHRRYTLRERGHAVPRDGGSPGGHAAHSPRVQAVAAPDSREVILRERDIRRRQEAELRVKELRERLVDREEIIREVREAFAALPEITIPPPRVETDPRDPRTAILFLSDIHVGQMVHRTSVGGVGEYDLRLFEARAHKIAQKVAAFVADWRQNRTVDRLVIVFAGDHLDGRTIHGGQAVESVGIGIQFRVGTEVLAQAILAPLAALFPDIHIFAVPGNHGRIGKKGEFDRVLDSLDLVFMDMLKLRCRGIANITWHPWETWYAWFVLHNHTFFVAHGDAFKAWLGIPFYGANRYKANLESLLHQPIDVLMVGHHHSPAGWDRAFSQIVMNGSWVGASNFGAWQGMGGPPVQKLLLVSDDYVDSFNLYLERREDCLTTQPVRIPT